MSPVDMAAEHGDPRYLQPYETFASDCPTCPLIFTAAAPRDAWEQNVQHQMKDHQMPVEDARSLAVASKLFREGMGGRW